MSKKKDFLNCHGIRSVQEDLERYGEKDFKGECLSDFIFLYDKKLKKKRVCLLITGKHVFVYDLAKWKLLFVGELGELKAVSIASKNCTLLSFHFMRGDDLLIESYRRIDLIVVVRVVIVFHTAARRDAVVQRVKAGRDSDYDRHHGQRIEEG